MKNINKSEMININGGGVATQIYIDMISMFSTRSKVASLEITNMKESTIRNLTNKLANGGYVSIITKDGKKKYIEVTKRQ